MANVAKGKRKLLAVAVATCVVAALVAVPAYAMFHVHTEGHTQGSTAQGAMEVCLTVNLEAVGGANTADMMFIPNGGTVADVLEEGILSSENQNGLDAIHNYDVTSVKDYLANHEYTIAVYAAGSQKEGTQTTHDTESLSSSEDYVLSRYDNVVVTVTK